MEHKKRSERSPNRILNLIEDTNSKNLKFDLLPSPKLIDDAFVLIRRYGSNIEMAAGNDTNAHRKLENCFYRSEDAAFDLCDNKLVRFPIMTYWFYFY